MAALLEAGVDAYRLRLLWLGVTSFAERGAQEASGESVWRLAYCDQAGASLCLGERAIALPPRRPILIPPICGDARADGRVRQLLVEFEFEPGHDYAPLGSNPGPEPLVLGADDLRDHLCARLRRDLGEAEPIHSATLARAKALVHLSVAAAYELGGPALAAIDSSDDGPRQVQPVLDYIEAHLEEPLDNQRLAAVVHASESHFIRLFRRVVGCTPARHVQERRVQRAAGLLTRTSLTIDEVAERCGFANRYHFSRVFAQRMVEPPGRFRNRHASRTSAPDSGSPA